MWRGQSHRSAACACTCPHGLLVVGSAHQGLYGREPGALRVASSKRPAGAIAPFWGRLRPPVAHACGDALCMHARVGCCLQVLLNRGVVDGNSAMTSGGIAVQEGYDNVTQPYIVDYPTNSALRHSFSATNFTNNRCAARTGRGHYLNANGHAHVAGMPTACTAPGLQTATLVFATVGPPACLGVCVRAS
jgi:hypothetical protein